MTAQEGVEVPISELRDAIKAVRARAERHNDRWALGLAIGNGGALLALGSKIIEKFDNELIALAMPSLWLFAGGLILAGASPLAEVLHCQRWTNKYLKVLDLAERNGFETVARQPAGTNDNSNNHIWIIELGSATAFLSGLIYPLSVLCIRYMSTGTFS